MPQQIAQMLPRKAGQSRRPFLRLHETQVMNGELCTRGKSRQRHPAWSSSWHDRPLLDMSVGSSGHCAVCMKTDALLIYRQRRDCYHIPFTAESNCPGEFSDCGRSKPQMPGIPNGCTVLRLQSPSSCSLRVGESFIADLPKLVEARHDFVVFEL